MADSTTPKKIYLFSGLGADERVFQKINFPDFEPVFIKWITPLKNETIQRYVSRIREQIDTEKPILIGLSFGGIIAVELARQMETEKIILISSAKTEQEIPFYFRFAGKLRVHKILPAWLLTCPNRVTNWFFGAKARSEKELLRQILADTDPAFLQWAINQALTWKSAVASGNIFHIHGTHDRILPLRFVNCDIRVNQGGHLMTLTQSEEVSTILRQQLMV